MKKTTKIILIVTLSVILVLAVLLVPIKQTEDHDMSYFYGTEIYRSLTYTYVKYNPLAIETYKIPEYDLYLFPNNFKSNKEIINLAKDPSRVKKNDLQLILEKNISNEEKIKQIEAIEDTFYSYIGTYTFTKKILSGETEPPSKRMTLDEVKKIIDTENNFDKILAALAERQPIPDFEGHYYDIHQALGYWFDDYGEEGIYIDCTDSIFYYKVVQRRNVFPYGGKLELLFYKNE